MSLLPQTDAERVAALRKLNLLDNDGGASFDEIVRRVTETMLLVNDLERVRTVLERLKAAGISIALDDFGTGFSSLTHLKVFPIDKVKIDRSFVSDLACDRNAQSIVAAVIAMAQRLSITVIAEGIENDVQLAMLRQMDCAMGQGFLLAPPRRLAPPGHGDKQ